MQTQAVLSVVTLHFDSALSEGLLSPFPLHRERTPECFCGNTCLIGIFMVLFFMYAGCPERHPCSVHRTS